MFFRAAVISLLGCLVLLHVESEVRRADGTNTPAPTFIIPAAPAAAAAIPPSPPPPEPVPAHAHTLVAPETRLVDISGAELDRLFIGTDLARAARVVPHFHDGHRCGVKLYAIRPGTLFEALGVRNGDVLLAIDDVPVEHAAERVADLAARAADARFIDLTLQRNGLPLRIVILVHR